MLIAWSLARNPAWRPARSRVWWAAGATLVCLIAMFVYMGIALPRQGGFGPELLVGWFNRLLVASYFVWQIVVARACVAAGAAR